MAEKMLELKKEVFTKDGFVSALNTLKWMRIGRDSDIGVRSKVKTFIKQLEPHRESWEDIRKELLEALEVPKTKTGYEFETIEQRQEFESRIEKLKPETFQIRHEAFRLDEETSSKLTIEEELTLEKYGIIK